MMETVRQTIRNHDLIRAGDHVLVGVSGGADSVCLLSVLSELKEEFSFSLTALHLNHQLRGDAADQDEAFVKELCAMQGIPCITKRVPVRELAKRDGIGTEECGRRERYAFFRAQGANQIAVAHHRQDQAETVLMHLVRGSGSRGLCGMDYRNGDVIRPLLDVSREEILAYLAEHHLPHREDESNQDIAYTRNRLRNRVFPELNQINPNASEAIAECAARLREEESFWTAQVKQAMKDSVTETEDGCFVNQAEFLNLHPALRRRVILQLFSRWNLPADSRMVTETEALFLKPTGTRLALKNGIFLVKDYEGIRPETEAEAPEFSYTVKAGERVWIPELDRWLVLETDTVHIPGTAEFDADLLPSVFTVRSRRNGDRFQPFGMEGSKKVKDYLIDAKIPQKTRNQIIVLEADGVIYDIVPLRKSRLGPVTEDTKRILRIRIEEKSDEK